MPLDHTQPWRPTKTSNGWFPKLHPTGNYVLYGFWQTWIANLTTGEEQEVLAPAAPDGHRPRLHPVGWHTDTTFIAVTEEGPAAVYSVDLHTLKLTNLNVANFRGMSFGSSGAGHWGIYLADNNGNYQYCVKDGVPFHPEIKQYGCYVNGDHLLTADMNANYELLHFVGNDVVRRLPGDNKWQCNDYGDVTTGYYGPVHLYPKGEGHIDATITPWRREEPGPPVRVNGELWLWTAADESENGLVLGRRVGETKPIVLHDFPSVQTAAVWTGTLWVIAGNSDKGALQVRWVSMEHPRESLSTRRPVSALPPLPGSRWGGYYKVKGRYGDWTGDAKQVGATLMLSGLGDEDSTLTPAQKAAEQTKWLTKCRNNNLSVSCGTSREDIAVYKAFWDIVAFIYVTAEGTATNPFDITAVEKQVRDTEAILKEFKLPRRPFMLYIDGDITTGNYRWPVGIDWQAINLYVNPDAQGSSAEAIKQLRASWDRQQRLIPTNKRLVLICQAYDRNGAWKNLDSLMDIQPEYQSFMKDSRCVGALFFAYSRPGGVTTYPDLALWHTEIFKSIPTKPSIQTIPWPEEVALPKFTIVSYEPKEGPIPFRVKAIYEKEPGAGQIDTIIWRWRPEGGNIWVNDATNPGWDPDHTFTFSTPGSYEISAQTKGPGGTWETASKRVVTALRPFEPPPPPPPPPPANTYVSGERGVQLGFGAPIGEHIYRELASRGWDAGRVTATNDPLLNQQIVDEVIAQRMRPIVLCFPEQIELIPEWVDIEILNEPNVGGHQWPKMDALTYARLVNDALPKAQARHQRVWAGAISNPSALGLAWLAGAVALLDPSVGISIHRYPERTGDAPSVPRADYKTREQEIQSILKVVGNRPWGVTEFGWKQDEYSTATTWWQKILDALGGNYKARLTDEQVSRYAREEFALWKQYGAQFAVWYQLNDGPSSDLYGLRRADGTWKPTADIFKE